MNKPSHRFVNLEATFNISTFILYYITLNLNVFLKNIFLEYGHLFHIEVVRLFKEL